MADQPTRLADMLREANQAIQAVSAERAIKLAAREDHLLVDLRDIRELKREGRIDGALHCPRGLLEFWIDEDSTYHKPAFKQPGTTYVFFCAGGLRSALATKTAQDMGLAPVMHIEGGFGAWMEAGGPVVKDEE